MPAVSLIADRVARARFRVRRRAAAYRDRVALEVGHRLDRVRLPGLPALRDRRRTAVASRFMDYGPDWPPAPRPSPVTHPLLRRCLAVVVLYAVIWLLGSALLDFRLYQLRGVTGVPTTTYTTITDSPHHRHH
jgi:hypothetical protein